MTKKGTRDKTAFRRLRATRGRGRGFTILEILIASAIMVVGLIGVLALFPAGISSGRKVVENSTAIAVARSVADGIRIGMRNNLRYRTSRGGGVFTYFVFSHDGVKNDLPRDQANEKPGHDYYILLPRFRENRKFAKGRRGRQDASESAPVFVYPESDPDVSSDKAPNGRGNPFDADDDGDDFNVTYTTSGGREEVFDDIFVRQVYRLGGTFPEPHEEGIDVLEDQTREVLKQYSFAFAVQPSYYDANMLDSGDGFKPGNELYTFRVMVFRAFPKNKETKDGPDLGLTKIADAEPVTPIFELDFDVAR